MWCDAPAMTMPWVNGDADDDDDDDDGDDDDDNDGDDDDDDDGGDDYDDVRNGCVIVISPSRARNQCQGPPHRILVIFSGVGPKHLPWHWTCDGIGRMTKWLRQNGSDKMATGSHNGYGNNVTAMTK